MFALIDCNNFYASCERLFRPDLKTTPIIVLSNNDGCAVARSNEAKALGIKMGEPFFKIKALCQENQVAVFSSNYTLYGDISARVMSIIEQAWPETEIYSIDEAFLDLSRMPSRQTHRFCEKLQQKILKDTSIPTSIGIGETKTLAKVANHIAKKKLKIPVFDISQQSQWLREIPINDIWGVGRRLTLKLVNMGINNASDLAESNHSLIRQKFNVVLERTALELRGISCLALEETTPKKSLISSKSFGTMQTDLKDLEQAISSHVARAWEKMRAQKLMTSYLGVFIYSNRFRDDLAQYSNSIGFKLLTPSDDLRHLTHFAKQCLKQIYKKDIQYKKAGVLFDGLLPRHNQQADLFHTIDKEVATQSDKLMQTIEQINGRFGRSMLRLAAEGHYKPWSMRRELKSPNYTTQWNELPTVIIQNKPS